MDKYKDLFIEESKERLEELDNQILTLEKNPSDKEIINGMFRTAHTFKGMAATMAYNDMAHMTHLMENLMTIIKSGNHTPDEEIISLLFECRDVLESSIEAIENGEENQIDYSAVQEHLDSYISKLNKKDQENRSKSLSPKTEVLTKTNNESEEGNHKVEKNDQGKGSSTSENLSVKVEKANDSENVDLLEQYKEEMQLSSSEKAKIDSEIDKNNSLYLVKIKLFDRTEMRYARAYLCIKKIKDFGELIKTIPGEKLIKEEAFGTQFSVVVIIPNHKKIKYLEQDIESIAAVEKYEIIKIKSVSSKDVIQTNDKKMKLNKDKDFSIQNVKVSINHLDDLMNMTGELLITKIRLDNIAQHNNITELDEVLTRINRITFDLQDKVLQMRMIPVSHIFDRFPRMVRDLAKKMGKMIDFSMEGRDIELDRTIIDQIGDPIVHLLRNSVDHGIEGPKEREAKKKNKIASLKLRAYRDKNFVVIEVSDDGGGIDYEKVKQKALSSHLILSDDAQKMTENDLKNLLLGGGISTATKVSEISGRGVGLGV
ncbi:MAG: chemotaxis protein CheA, partial [Promethearchaeota archaeon]